MYRLILFILLTTLSAISIGVYLRYQGNILLGDKFIGFSTLAIVLILMPLFIFKRYKNKRIKDYLINKKD